MNYNNISELLVAETTNMTSIWSGTNDDGYYSLTSPSWFYYNNYHPNNIYISGNAFFSFTGSTSSETLQVYRHDARLRRLYTESGILLDTNTEFFKIRWYGDSYGSKNNYWWFDVVLFNNGSIIIYLGKITAMSGTSSFNNISFSPTVKQCVTFYSSDDYGSSYTGPFYEEPIFKERITKYLLEKNNIYYSIENNTVVEKFNSTIEPTEQQFIDYGFKNDKNTNIDWNILRPLDNFKFYIYKNIENLNFEFNITAKPYTQYLYSDIIEISDNKKLMTQQQNLGGLAPIKFSFDKGSNWYIYDMNSSTYIKVDENDDNYMTSSDFINISYEVLNEKISDSLIFKIKLEATSDKIPQFKFMFG